MNGCGGRIQIDVDGNYIEGSFLQHNHDPDVREQKVAKVSVNKSKRL